MMARGRAAAGVVWTLLALPIAAALLLFNARRLLFLAVAALDLGGRGRLRPGRAAPASGRMIIRPDALPGLLVLAPMRNELGSLEGLAASLLALDYPTDRLTIGLIDDASTDGSAAAMEHLAARHRRLQVLHNPRRLGKADSLNAGLQRWLDGEIVAVYDADTRPQPESLRQIAAAFADDNVAAAGGLIRPANGLASLTASYGALERLVHQQVTLRAKDRLDLAPAILGSNCAYRRTSLEAAGGFPSGALLEDSHLTVDLARRGWRTRFLPEAAAADRVPETLGGYWRQHVRWSRGFADVAARQLPGQRTARPARRAPGPATPVATEPRTPGVSPVRRWFQRTELALFSLGYLDRLALLASIGLLALRRLAGAGSRATELLAALLAANVALPYVQAILALLAERAPAAWWTRLPVLPFFFAVDAAAAAWSTAMSASRRPAVWQPTERSLAEVDAAGQS